VESQALVEDIHVPLAEVEVSRSTAAWSVAGDGWKQILPDLPDEVIALLATPVVVSAARVVPVVVSAERVVPVVVSADRLAPAPRARAESLAVPVAARVPQFLAPAPPKRVRPRRRRRP
jgi:hypothetical protein